MAFGTLNVMRLCPSCGYPDPCGCIVGSDAADTIEVRSHEESLKHDPVGVYCVEDLRERFDDFKFRQRVRPTIECGYCKSRPNGDGEIESIRKAYDWFIHHECVGSTPAFPKGRSLRPGGTPRDWADTWEQNWWYAYFGRIKARVAQPIEAWPSRPLRRTRWVDPRDVREMRDRQHHTRRPVDSP